MTQEQRQKGYTVTDRRWWLDEEKLEQAAEREPQVKPHYVEEMERRLEEKERLLREYIEAHKASRADLEGARRRVEAELERRADLERTRLAASLLEILDGIEHLEKNVRPEATAENLAAGVKLLGRLVRRELEKLELEKIPAQGRPFDPKLMAAMATEAVDAERENEVIEVLQTGYTLKGNLVRPAGVKVGVPRQS